MGDLTLIDRIRQFEKHRIKVGDTYGAEILHHAAIALARSERQWEEEELRIRREWEETRLERNALRTVLQDLIDERELHRCYCLPGALHCALHRAYALLGEEDGENNDVS
jgi:hypothetical protein